MTEYSCWTPEFLNQENIVFMRYVLRRWYDIVAVVFQHVRGDFGGDFAIVRGDFAIGTYAEFLSEMGCKSF